MKKDLNFLLFKMNVLQNGNSKKKPFFRFQNELAEAIVNSPGYYSDKELKNMRPYLNQVLKSGDMAYEKPMSENLKKQILKILKERVSKKDPLFAKLDEEFDKAYTILKQKKSEEDNLYPNEDYQELLEWGLKGNNFTILLNEPGEIYWSPKKKTRDDIDYLLNWIFEIAFKNFKETQQEILPSFKNGKLKLTLNKEKHNLFSYNIYLPNYSIAIRFWQKLFQFFYEEKLRGYNYSKEDKFKITEVFFKSINTFQNSNSKESINILNVYKIEPYLTTIPIVHCQSSTPIINGLDNKSFEEAFTMNLDKGFIKGVLKLSPSSFSEWKEHVYYKLNPTNNKNPFGIEPINFKNFETDIINIIDFDN